MAGNGSGALIYALVARSSTGTVLVDYTAYNGNFATVAVQCLQKCSKNNSRFTYTCDRHNFNFLVKDGLTYMVVADQEFSREVSFALLEKVAEDFTAKYDESQWEGAIAHSMDKAYGPKLKKFLDEGTRNPGSFAKVVAVRQQVAEVKDIMMDNIEKVLDRGEKIELLVDKTNDLRFQADNFNRTGRALRRRMWWQNFKMKLIIAAFVLGVLLVVICLICFSGGKNNCK